MYRWISWSSERKAMPPCHHVSMMIRGGVPQLFLHMISWSLIRLEESGMLEDLPNDPSYMENLPS